MRDPPLAKPTKFVCAFMWWAGNRSTKDSHAGLIQQTNKHNLRKESMHDVKGAKHVAGSCTT